MVLGYQKFEAFAIPAVRNVAPSGFVFSTQSAIAAAPELALPGYQPCQVVLDKSQISKCGVCIYEDIKSPVSSNIHIFIVY